MGLPAIFVAISFSYEPYTKLIFEKQILESLLNSLYVGGVTVICSVAIGFYFANYYHTSKSKMKEVLQFIIFLPFLLPPIITGLSLLIFFREMNLPRSLNTVVIGHTIFVLAIVFKIILNKLETLKPSLMESAYDLGASKFQAFWYVLLPNIKLSINDEVIQNQVINIFKKHDLFVLPTRGENFGYVIIESLSAGLPALISDKTSWKPNAESGLQTLSLDEHKWEKVITNWCKFDDEILMKTRYDSLNYAMNYNANNSSLKKNRVLFNSVLDNNNIV